MTGFGISGVDLSGYAKKCWLVQPLGEIGLRENRYSVNQEDSSLILKANIFPIKFLKCI
jgi:hypothetical protein